MKRSLLLAAAFAVASPSLSAQTVVVNGPGTTFTNPGVPAPSNYNDPGCSGTAVWCARNLRTTGEVGITSTYARSGNGSLYFAGNDGSAKADFQYLLSQPVALSSFTGASFDYFRDAASNNPENQAPAFRLLIGNAAGTVGGYLIYEPVYNGVATITEGAWQTASITGSTNLWLRYFGPPGQTLENYGITLDTWKSGVNAFGITFDGDFLVRGIEVGTGSGWNGTFRGAVDNVSYQVGTAPAVTFNFEVASVPEPASMALTLTGLAGLVAARRRRQR